MGENNGVGAAGNRPEYHIDGVGGSEDMTTPISKPTTAPAFQFYPKDFLTSPKVRQMSLTERGAYITLLALAWMDGGLPSDPKALAIELHIPLRQFERMWAGVLGECFQERDGRLVNPRMESIREDLAEFRRRASDHGRKGGRPKKGSGSPEERVPFPNPFQNQKGKESSPISDLHTASTVQSATHSVARASEEPLDGAFAAFRDAYPGSRRDGGPIIEQSFIDQCFKAGGPSVLMEALANHKQSDQWQTPKLIPSMETWLTKERWRQQLPVAKPVGVGITPRTAGNVESLRRFVNRGQS